MEVCNLSSISVSPLVSVVVPTFNDGEEKLRKTLKSILAQSYSAIEIIVSDDGGDYPFSNLDNKINDKRVRWLNNQHRGVACTRNSAIEAARGEFIAFLDAGDWWENDKLEKQMEVFAQNPDLAMVYASAVTHDPYGRSSKLKAVKYGDLFCELLVGQPIVGSCSAVVVPRQILDQVGGFYTDEDIPEDQDLWLRISKIGNVGFAPEYLVHLEVGLMSRSADPAAKMRPYQRYLELHADEIEREGVVNKAWSNYYISIADKYFSLGKFLPGIIYVVRGLRAELTREGLIRLFAGFFSIFGSSAYSYIKYKYRSRNDK